MEHHPILSSPEQGFGHCLLARIPFMKTCWGQGSEGVEHFVGHFFA